MEYNYPEANMEATDERIGAMYSLCHIAESCSEELVWPTVLVGS